MSSGVDTTRRRYRNNKTILNIYIFGHCYAAVARVAPWQCYSQLQLRIIVHGRIGCDPVQGADMTAIAGQTLKLPTLPIMEDISTAIESAILERGSAQRLAAVFAKASTLVSASSNEQRLFESYRTTEEVLSRRVQHSPSCSYWSCVKYTKGLTPGNISIP